MHLYNSTLLRCIWTLDVNISQMDCNKWLINIENSSLLSQIINHVWTIQKVNSSTLKRFSSLSYTKKPPCFSCLSTRKWSISECSVSIVLHHQCTTTYCLTIIKVATCKIKCATWTLKNSTIQWTHRTEHRPLFYYIRTNYMESTSILC